MKLEENELRTLWEQDAPETDENVALSRVLNTSAQLTGVKDIAGLFVGWIWVIFLGFGASAYSAKRRFELHQQQQKILLKNKQTNDKNLSGE
ncbi:MAG: hypothetical protein ACI88A_002931 [Paraglaciecola sp.]